MARRMRPELILEEAQQPESRLQALDDEHAREVRAIKAHYDEVLSDDGPIATAVLPFAGSGEFLETIAGALGEFATEHARGYVEHEGERLAKRRRRGALRQRRDPDVRWRDEIEALRAWWLGAAPVRAGDMQRTLDRIAMGATITSSTRNAEPRIDEGIAAVGRALGELSDEQRAWLLWTYVEIEAPLAKMTDGKAVATIVASGRSAMSIAAGVREGTDTLPRWSEIGACPDGSWGHVTWQLIVAERAGGGATCGHVDGVVRGARRALRDALRRVEFDAVPRFLIALPSMQERAHERDEAPTEACFGATVVDGVMGPCSVADVPAWKVDAAPRCERCGMGMV